MSMNDHSIFLLNDGTVKIVGKNDYGQCGTGTTNTQLTLYTIPNLTNVKQISCGGYHSAFLLDDGTVKTAGYNNFGQCGTGRSTNTQLTLYTIPNLTNVKQISCGRDHSIFLLNDGTVKTVGGNGYGQCGTGTTNTQLTLYTIPNLTNVKQISCGKNHSVFLLNDGTVKTVGGNGYGQCGTGTTNTQLPIYTIPNLTNVKQVTCGGDHTVFLLNDGTVKTVGSNNNGQCGTGSTTTTQLPIYTIPNLTNVKQVACGENHSVFLLNDGTVKTVGGNGYGQCGTGTTNTQLPIYTIPNLTNVKQVTCGATHSVFLLNDGTVKTVGSNNNGQCGTGTGNTPQLTLYTIPSITTAIRIFNTFKITTIKYLINKYGNYYSINPIYYDTTEKTYIPLILSGGVSPTPSDVDSYGFDTIDNLTNLTTINEETFKPINKLSSNFSIKCYKST